MFGFGFALVPFYEKICEVTGLRNIAQADAPANTQVDTSRTLRIEFDTNVRNLPWQFKAKEPVVAVHPGALTQVMFEIVNTTDRPVTGQAIPSYGPQHAAQYFRKLDCFCFAKQTLAPGERARDAGRVRHRSVRAARAQHDFALVHVLRGRGQRRQGLDGDPG